MGKKEKRGKRHAAAASAAALETSSTPPSSSAFGLTDSESEALAVERRMKKFANYEAVGGAEDLTTEVNETTLDATLKRRKRKKKRESASSSGAFETTIYDSSADLPPPSASTTPRTGAVVQPAASSSGFDEAMIGGLPNLVNRHKSSGGGTSRHAAAKATHDTQIVSSPSSGALSQKLPNIGISRTSMHHSQFESVDSGGGSVMEGTTHTPREKSHRKNRSG